MRYFRRGRHRANRFSLRVADLVERQRGDKEFRRSMDVLRHMWGAR